VQPTADSIRMLTISGTVGNEKNVIFLNFKKTSIFSHMFCLCLSCYSPNKLRLMPYAALIVWSL
jgi:hypothetical protein